LSSQLEPVFPRVKELLLRNLSHVRLHIKFENKVNYPIDDYVRLVPARSLDFLSIEIPCVYDSAALCRLLLHSNQLKRVHFIAMMLSHSTDGHCSSSCIMIHRTCLHGSTRTRAAADLRRRQGLKDFLVKWYLARAKGVAIAESCLQIRRRSKGIEAILVGY
jgi:hypothetical protein